MHISNQRCPYALALRLSLVTRVYKSNNRDAIRRKWIVTKVFTNIWNYYLKYKIEQILKRSVIDFISIKDTDKKMWYEC